MDLPYTRPTFQGTDRISSENAHLAAAQCQGCEFPACVRDCPAGVDIPGFLRRMEAQNYAGAARLLRERNPFSEVCGHTCLPDPACQRRCHRRSFAGEPVRIAELERWVCEAGGSEGWLRPDQAEKGWNVAVVGAGVSGLSCAYYLALSGGHVDVYDEGTGPGDRLSQARAGDLPQAAVARDVKALLLPGIHFHGSLKLGPDLVEDLRRSHDALYLDAGSFGIAPTDSAGTRPASGSPGCSCVQARRAAKPWSGQRPPAAAQPWQ